MWVARCPVVCICIVSFISCAFILSMTGQVDAAHTHSDLQPAAVSILDGPLEDCRHVAYFHGDAFTWMQLKHAPANRQIVNLQTGRAKARNITWLPIAYLSMYVCIYEYVSTHLSRPYKTLPIKSMDFSPFTLGYLVCLNAASITFVVFSFTSKTQKLKSLDTDIQFEIK